MKTILIRLTVVAAFIIGTVCICSMLITEESITVLTLLTALYFVRFLVRTALYVFFTLVRWLCIIPSGPRRSFRGSGVTS